MAGETNLMPPATPTKGNTLIFDVLALSAVEGELHEGLSRQCEAVRVGFEGGSRVMNFTREAAALAGRWCVPNGTLLFALRAIGELT